MGPTSEDTLHAHICLKCWRCLSSHHCGAGGVRGRMKERGTAKGAGRQRGQVSWAGRCSLGSLLREEPEPAARPCHTASPPAKGSIPLMGGPRGHHCPISLPIQPGLNYPKSSAPRRTSESPVRSQQSFPGRKRWRFKQVLT